MKHLHIVDPYRSAAMQRMTGPLLNALPALYTVTTGPEVDTAADLNFHCPWHTLVGLEDRGAGKHAIQYTHCNKGAEASLADACARANLITAMGFRGRQELIDLGVDPAKIWVVYAAADGFRYTPRVVGVVGYAQPNARKRESLLLDLAWQHDLSAFQFLLVGQGWDGIAAQLQSLGVRATAAVADSPEKMTQAYSLMDALLVTGYAEGGPLPLLEAMSAGVRVLSPNFGYAADLLPETDIYDTPADLAEKLHAMTATSTHNHLLARAWSWDDYAAEHALLFGRLLGESVDLYPERGMSRYAQLLDAIDEARPARIAEIGTWNGNRAIQMIQQAAKYRAVEDVQYQGFDLFDAQSAQDLRRELSKIGWPQEIVRRRIEATGASVRLHAGYSTETLPVHLDGADFYFVDGGHSEATVDNDGTETLMLMFNQPGAVAIFDDYYLAGKPEGMGCNTFIEGLNREVWDVRFLPAHTEASDGRVIGMVKVRLRNGNVSVPMRAEARATGGTWYVGEPGDNLPTVSYTYAQGAPGCRGQLERPTAASGGHAPA